MGNIFVIIAFVAYALVILGIGIFSYKKSKSMNDYFIGGRQLGSWTTAISAQASDMSGWLLMGLPGAIFVSGLTESWIAIGLFIGTYLNWKILAARLRKMSYAAGDAITIPEYFQKRFFTQNPVIRFACAAIIFVFFLIYTASAFSSGAKLFNYMFGTDYTLSLTIGALIIISYTFLGGFFAVCWTDLIQGLLMFAALVVVPLVCIIQTPDVSTVQFLNADGAVISNYLNLFENVNGDIAWTTILSGLAWGLGYFGMPHILVRFMAIKSSDLIKKSRIIATIWVFITLGAAVLVGIFGYIFLHSAGNEAMLAEFNAIGDAERIFMFLSGKLLPGIIAGYPGGYHEHCGFPAPRDRFLCEQRYVQALQEGRQGKDPHVDQPRHRYCGRSHCVHHRPRPEQLGNGSGFLRMGRPRSGVRSGYAALAVLEAHDHERRSCRYYLRRRVRCHLGDYPDDPRRRRVCKPLQCNRYLLAAACVHYRAGCRNYRVPLHQGRQAEGRRAFCKG